ncbi:MAG: hypothetical protein E6L03_09010 [Thaumarchaeota archaeon]|nr:MAG: hypothetical protein E6L03_09010 [Nitrososphaerota archaeon]
MGDRAFAVSTVMMFIWIALWMLAYDNIWLKIPFVADMFPLPLPNGTLTYSDAVTSIGIIGTLILGAMVGYTSMKIAKESSGRGFHRN